MKIIRSSKCSLKFATRSKLDRIGVVLSEYRKVCQHFIDLFWGWEVPPQNRDMLKPVLDTANTWFGARMRKLAAREAGGLVRSARSLKGSKPRHGGKSAHLGETVATIRQTPGGSFDLWVSLTCIGGGMKLLLPLKSHHHLNLLLAEGSLRKGIILREDSIQLVVEIETGPKREPDNCVGVDTGIKVLASLSTGEQIGSDLPDLLALSKRKKWGSKGHKRAQRRVRQRIDEVAKQVAGKASLIVTEDLLGIAHKTRRRLGKEMRRSVGIWNVRYWLTRLEQQCERNRVSFRRVSPRHTSQTCSRCGHIDRRNRQGELFACRGCGHTDNADVQASRNILARFLSGPYGAGCKASSELMFTG